jgi:multidrug efflux pump subunit AcrA (membrane-fusion protein)
MKKYNYAYTLVFCLLNICPFLAYAHGEHDNAPVRKKTTQIINKIEKTAKPINIEPQLQEQNNSLNISSIVLNAKVVANPEHVRYIFSQFDGLLNIKQPIILGQMVKKGQVLGSITTILSPLESANQNNQIAILKGEMQQHQAKLKRYQTVPELTAKKDIDETSLNIQSLQKQIKILQTSLQRQQTLTAPISGIVTQSNLNANKVVDNKTELVQISPINANNIEIQAEYYLTDINFNPNKNSQAFLLNSEQKIPLVYLGYIPFISSPYNKNSVILRFNLPKNEDLNLILGQSLNIEFQSEAKGAKNVK